MVSTSECFGHSSHASSSSSKRGRLGRFCFCAVRGGTGSEAGSACGWGSGSWAGMIERYLLEREPLEMVMVLVDAEVGPTKLDAQMLDWLRAEALPHSVVATKLDKVKSSQRPKRKKELAAGCQLEVGDIVWTSTTKDIGLDSLRSLVKLWLST